VRPLVEGADEDFKGEAVVRLLNPVTEEVVKAKPAVEPTVAEVVSVASVVEVAEVIVAPVTAPADTDQLSACALATDSPSEGSREAGPGTTETSTETPIETSIEIPTDIPTEASIDVPAEAPAETRPKAAPPPWKKQRQKQASPTKEGLASPRGGGSVTLLHRADSAGAGAGGQESPAWPSKPDASGKMSLVCINVVISFLFLSMSHTPGCK
jgi:hypothetical protein